MRKGDIPDEIIAPLLAVASACVAYIATEDKVYTAWSKWSTDNIKPPPGFKQIPKPPSQESLAMSARLLIMLGTGNMTLDQRAVLDVVKYLEGGSN
jgi:hypothetical protein